MSGVNAFQTFWRTTALSSGRPVSQMVFQLRGTPPLCFVLGIVPAHSLTAGLWPSESWSPVTVLRIHFSPLENSWFTWTTDFRRKTNTSLKGGLESSRQVSPNFLGPSLTFIGDVFQVTFTPRVGIWACRNPFRQDDWGSVRDLTKRVSLTSQDFEESFSLGCLWFYPLIKDKDNNNIYFRMSSWALGEVSAIKLVCACSVVQSCCLWPHGP